MSVLLRVLALFGWRGVVAAAAGGLLAALPAYHTGRILEGAASEARIEAALANNRLSRMEIEHERLLTADRARQSARAQLGSDGRVPDDGFLRD